LEAEIVIASFSSGPIDQQELLNNQLAAIYRAANDSRQLRFTESVAASLAVVRGHYAQAVAGYRALVGRPPTVDGRIAVLSGLFGALLLQGEINEAEQFARAIAPQCRGVSEYVHSMFVLRLALLLGRRERLEDAARLLGYGTRWHERTGWRLDDEDRRFLNETEGLLAEKLPAARRAALNLEGKSLSEDGVLALVPRPTR